MPSFSSTIAVASAAAAAVMIMQVVPPTLVALVKPLYIILIVACFVDRAY